MKTMIQILGMLAAIAGGEALLACAPSSAASEPQASAAAPTSSPPPLAAPAPRGKPRAAEQKISAPVDVSLTASARSGTVILTLSLKAETDIPHAVARFVLPREVKLVNGQPEIDIPLLRRGVVSQLQVTVEVPAKGQFTIYAGVDCPISSGILLHKSAPEVVLGQ